MADFINVASLNVCGLRNAKKRKQIFKMLKEKKTDIACLQETYITNNDYVRWKKEWGGEMFFFEGTKHGRGQVTLIRNKLPFECTPEILEDRIVSINIKAEKEICIFNIYAPCGQRDTKEFLVNLKPTVEKSKAEIKILCGDFNTVMCNDKDIISGEKHSTPLVNAFNNLKEECELHDVWRVFNRENKEYTWSRKKNNQFIARRLDYILVNDNAMDNIRESNLFSVPSSDHRGVEIVIKCSDSKRGPGYYKFNNSLLKNSTFVNKMNTIIDTFLSENNNVNAIDKLELLKITIREESIQFSKTLAAQRRNQAIDMYNKLNKCESALAKDPNNIGLLAECNKLKSNIEIREQTDLKGAQLRSKQKYISEGDKNTKFFLNLEKSRANSKIIPSLELENGNVVTDQFSILNAQKEYYRSLYNKENNHDNLENHIDTFLGDTNIPNLTNPERETCEGLINIEEASKALQMLNNNSSPGPDGLTAEFYKCFWLKLRNTVVDSFNESFTTGQISYTQSSAILTLLHKGKDLPKNKLNNWRPISLTNTDYKILAKCLANRVGKVIGKIVSEDQVGYIKGRNVSTTLRTIDDIINMWNLKQRPGILLALDFQKAFDSISKQFMLSAFKKFGFGSDLLQWVKILFTDTKSSIIYNGWVSENFNVTNGIRQGCPFSPLAFIIGVELLAIRFRESRDVKGLNIDVENVIKVLLYADDITVFLKDENDVRAVISIIKEFSQISALRLNLTKSEAMGIGSSKRLSFDIGVKWVKEIKVLGIYFSNEKTASENEHNWISKIDKIKQLINQWEKRNLGIWGKLCVIKSLMLSQIVYAMQAICFPENILKEINTLFYRFLWRKQDVNKRAFEKVKRVTLNADYNKGGIGMIDVIVMQESFLCNWFFKILKNENHTKWTLIPSLFLKSFGEDLSCFSSTVGPNRFKGLYKIELCFWKKVITTWLRHNTNSNLFKTKKMCIWNNKSFTYQNNVIFFENWAKKITFITDIIQNNTMKSFEEIEIILGPSPNLFLEYITVRASVLSYMKDNQIDTNLYRKEENWCFLNAESNPNAKSFRKHIDNTKYKESCAIRFWRNKFDINVDEEIWKISYEVTQESRLRELQWKILHNIYPTNILLLKMGITDTNKCPYCVNETDFIEHFFFHCQKIKILWKHIEDMYYIKFGQSVKITLIDVLIGRKKNSLTKEMYTLLNHSILIGKMCISKFRYGTPLNIILMFERECSIRKLNF